MALLPVGNASAQHVQGVTQLRTHTSNTQAPALHALVAVINRVNICFSYEITLVKIFNKIEVSIKIKISALLVLFRFLVWWYCIVLS
jgi:hypothetical protein